MHTEKASLQKRDTTVDIIRGISIFTMVAANLSGVLKLPDPPLYLRLFGTFAAPIFIFLSGMMVVATSTRYKLSHYLTRLAMIWAVAMITDWIVSQNSFSSVDVLWLIGLSLPLSYIFFEKIPSTKTQLALIALIFAATPFLQSKLGYAEDPETPFAFNRATLHHWLIDGWFPVFPWMGFSFLGVVFAKHRDSFARGKNFGWIALGTLLLGSTIWSVFYSPSESMPRYGFTELFYPPTLGYIFTAIGVIFFLFYLIQINPTLKPYRFAILLGECSLFMYVMQYFIETFVIHPLVSPNYEAYAFSYFAMMAALILMGYGIMHLKARWKKRPYVVKFLIG